MRKIASLVIVLALVAAACSDSSGNVVGSVGETTVTEGDLGALFESDTLPIDEGLREAIFALLARAVLIQGLQTDFGVSLDEAAAKIVYDDLVQEMETAGLTPADVLGIPDAGLGMVQFNADVTAIRNQAIDGIVAQPDTIAAFFSDPAAITTVCARHVLVATEDEALAVIDRLTAGEVLSDVAAEVSLDTGTPGGDLGCSVASRYVTEFADATLSAEIGVPVGPVESQFGFHVIVMDDRTAPTEAEFTADPLTFLSEEEINTLWGQWFNEKLDEADVVVDEKYGFWTSVGIVPPDRPDLVPSNG